MIELRITVIGLPQNHYLWECVNYCLRSLFYDQTLFTHLEAIIDLLHQIANFLFVFFN